MTKRGFPLLDVLSGGIPTRRPIWLMRQAGRYLPEYRAVRKQAGSFLKLCYTPAMACEVTLQPLRRFDLDAAILFSDILVVPHAMGLKLDFVEGEGPVLDRVGDAASVAALGDGVGCEQFACVNETVRLVSKGLDGGLSLIGFCGAPWTVASYMIEGRGSDRKLAVAAAVEGAPWFWSLIDRLVETSVGYLLGQIAAGAQVLQIFDSWAGDVPLHLRERLVLEPIAAMVAAVRAVHPGFPVIVFGRGVAEGHRQVAIATGASAVGVEETADLDRILETLPKGVAVQGNLAPAMLLKSEQELRVAVRGLVRSVPMKHHIFNLGHGIVPEVDPRMVEILVDEVRRTDGVA